jgi:hypothetical protein
MGNTMATASRPFTVQLAPDKLWQAINPWFANWFSNADHDQIGLFNISLGNGDEDLERDILERAGSYGRQIGHLADAFEVLLDLVEAIDPARFAALPQAQKDVLAIAKGDIAAIRAIKA